MMCSLFSTHRGPAPVVRVEIGLPSVQIGIGGGVVVHEHRERRYKRKHGRKRGHGRHDD